MSGTKSNNPQSSPNSLPDEVQALFFVCDCFGLGLESFKDRRKDKPRLRLSRETLRRARINEHISPKARERLRWRMFQRLRGRAVFPVVGITSAVADELVTLPLEIYGKLRPQLQANGTDLVRAIWVLAEHFFLPTAYQIVHRRHRWGLGSELRAGNCWYLPEQVKGELHKPIRRVLDRWLRVAGFKTAYGVTKHLVPKKSGNACMDDARWKSWKRSMERWLAGNPVGELKRLHSAVGVFANNVAWLDHPKAWTARITLAFALQNLWDEADKFFACIRSRPALELARAYRRLALHIHYDDDGHLLTDPRLFFAVRLIVTRLDQEGVLGKMKERARQASPPPPGQNASQSEFDAWRASCERERNLGNWIVAYLQTQATEAGWIKPTDHPLDSGTSLRDYITAMGVAEINALIQGQKAGRR